MWVILKAYLCVSASFSFLICIRRFFVLINFLIFSSSSSCCCCSTALMIFLSFICSLEKKFCVSLSRKISFTYKYLTRTCQTVTDSDPVISLLEIYPNEIMKKCTKFYVPCTSKLSIMVTSWKQPQIFNNGKMVK